MSTAASKSSLQARARKELALRQSGAKLTAGTSTPVTRRSQRSTNNVVDNPPAVLPAKLAAKAQPKNLKKGSGKKAPVVEAAPQKVVNGLVEEDDEGAQPVLKRSKGKASHDDEESDSDDGSAPAQSDSEDDDGDEGLSGLTEAQLAALIEQEQAVIIGSDIWDAPDDEVDVVLRPSGRESSKGDIGDFEEEVVAPATVKGSGKAKGKRQQAFDNEVPDIQDSKPVVQLDTLSTAQDAQPPRKVVRLWPAHARLVMDDGIRLQDQPEIIRIMVQSAIKKETASILIRSAWPNIGLRAEYCQRICREAATELLGDFPLLSDVIKRIDRDLEFCKHLGNIVIDRFSTTRAPAKTNTANQIAAYELGVKTKCKERVDSLMQDDRYIFPGEWIGNTNVYHPKVDSPYYHSSIVETLKLSFFSTPSSIGFRVAKKYNDMLTDAPKRILPPGMVALAATGVFAALLDWETGVLKKESRFEGNLYSSVYRSHYEFIDSLKVDKPGAYYGILSTLYEAVTQTDGSIVRQQSTRGPRGIMDLSKYN